MASLESLQTRAVLAKGTVVQKGSDESVALRLKYVGTGSVTSVITVTATSVEVITDLGTITADFATYTTVGAVADKLAATGEFQVKVLDVLRSAASDNNLLAGSLTATNKTDENGNLVYDIFTDSSAFFQYGACLSPARGFDVPKGGRVHLQAIDYVANVGIAAADSVQIWARKGTVERQLFGALSVDTTATQILFANGQGKITGGVDEELIVLVKDAGSLADGGYIRATGIIE